MPSLKSLLDAFAKRVAHGTMPSNNSQSGQAYVIYDVTIDSEGNYGVITVPFDCCASAEVNSATVSSDKKWLSFSNPSLYGGMGSVLYVPSEWQGHAAAGWTAASKGEIFHIFAAPGATVRVILYPKYLI